MTGVKAIKTKLQTIIDEDGFVDIGRGVEIALETTSAALFEAIQQLKEEGYKTCNIGAVQASTGKKMQMHLLTKEDVSHTEIFDLVGGHSRLSDSK